MILSLLPKSFRQHLKKPPLVTNSNAIFGLSGPHLEKVNQLKRFSHSIIHFRQKKFQKIAPWPNPNYQVIVVVGHSEKNDFSSVIFPFPFLENPLNPRYLVTNSYALFFSSFCDFHLLQQI